MAVGLAMLKLSRFLLVLSLCFSLSLSPFILSVSAHSVLHLSLPLSLALSLGQQMETMAQFCLLFWSPVGPVAFWTAHGSAPHISYKMQVPFLFKKDKKEAAEC